MKNILFVILCLSCSNSYAEKNSEILSDENRVEVMQTGRYSFMKNRPRVEQINPLKVMIKTKVPASVKTVGETVEYLLAPSGYSLADYSVLSDEAITLLNHELPQVHRDIGPMTLDVALHMLGGDAFELIVDPVNRKVAYEISVRSKVSKK